MSTGEGIAAAAVVATLAGTGITVLAKDSLRERVAGWLKRKPKDKPAPAPSPSPSPSPSPPTTPPQPAPPPTTGYPRVASLTEAELNALRVKMYSGKPLDLAALGLPADTIIGSGVGAARSILMSSTFPHNRGKTFFGIDTAFSGILEQRPFAVVVRDDEVLETTAGAPANIRGLKTAMFTTPGEQANPAFVPGTSAYIARVSSPSTSSPAAQPTPAATPPPSPPPASGDSKGWFKVPNVPVALPDSEDASVGLGRKLFEGTATGLVETSGFILGSTAGLAATATGQQRQLPKIKRDIGTTEDVLIGKTRLSEATSGKTPRWLDSLFKWGG